MCEQADQVSFYIGHTGGSPPPMIPRYEFLASLREYTDGLTPDGWLRAKERVEQTVHRIVDAIDAAGVAQDRDHNFMINKTLVKVLPYPIQQAHEHSKALGRKLEAELKSIVISRLIELKRLRASNPSQLTVRPISVQRYLQRFARVIKANEGQIDGNR